MKRQAGGGGRDHQSWWPINLNRYADSILVLKKSAS